MQKEKTYKVLDYYPFGSAIIITLFILLLSCKTPEMKLNGSDICINDIKIVLIEDSLGGQYIVAKNKSAPFFIDTWQGLKNGNVYGIITDCEGSSMMFYTNPLKNECREIKFTANKKLYLDSFYAIDPITLESQFSHTEYVYKPEFRNDSGWKKCNVARKIKNYRKRLID